MIRSMSRVSRCIDNGPMEIYSHIFQLAESLYNSWRKKEENNHSQNILHHYLIKNLQYDTIYDTIIK